MDENETDLEAVGRDGIEPSTRGLKVQQDPKRQILKEDRERAQSITWPEVGDLDGGPPALRRAQHLHAPSDTDVTPRHEPRTCFVCRVVEWFGKDKTVPFEEHHWPVPRRLGGTQTVSLCVTCHDALDRTRIRDWPWFEESFQFLWTKLEDWPRLLFMRFITNMVEADHEGRTVRDNDVDVRLAKQRELGRAAERERVLLWLRNAPPEATARELFEQIKEERHAAAPRRHRKRGAA